MWSQPQAAAAAAAAAAGVDNHPSPRRKKVQQQQQGLNVQQMLLQKQQNAARLRQEAAAQERLLDELKDAWGSVIQQFADFVGKPLPPSQRRQQQEDRVLVKLISLAFAEKVLQQTRKSQTTTMLLDCMVVCMVKRHWAQFRDPSRPTWTFLVWAKGQGVTNPEEAARVGFVLHVMLWKLPRRPPWCLEGECEGCCSARQGLGVPPTAGPLPLLHAIVRLQRAHTPMPTQPYMHAQHMHSCTVV